MMIKLIIVDIIIIQLLSHKPTEVLHSKTRLPFNLRHDQRRLLALSYQ